MTVEARIAAAAAAASMPHGPALFNTRSRKIYRRRSFEKMGREEMLNAPMHKVVLEHFSAVTHYSSTCTIKRHFALSCAYLQKSAK